MRSLEFIFTSPVNLCLYRAYYTINLYLESCLEYAYNRPVLAKIIIAFEKYGGYVVANSHHSLASIKGDNIVAMCQAVKGKIDES